MAARSSARLNGDVLTEQIFDRDRFLAVRTGATDADPTHEGLALLTPLPADGPGAAPVVGWPGGSHPPAPSDPGVKVSLHRAPLIDVQNARIHFHLSLIHI